MKNGVRRISVLGATGSVGRQTLDILSQNDGAFDVIALTAHRNVDELAHLARRHRAKVAVIADPDLYGDLKDALADSTVEAAAGPDALVEAAGRENDWTMAAIVGAAGLPATMAALETGTRLALANKEALVCAGDLVMATAARTGARILPVDSEHSGIFQCLATESMDRVARIALTASGGPFRTASFDDMRDVTPEQALQHPVWSMGAKISIDSATMMNKGLEVIEAFHLFGLSLDQLSVLIHPQSIVHGLVEYVDGSTIAQLGTPDMATPISYALAWPDRLPTRARLLDLAEVGRLDFAAPDAARFPALDLCRAALRTGGAAPLILNAANEVAVDAFLQRRIGFLDIVAVVTRILEQVSCDPVTDLAGVLDLDRVARAQAQAQIALIS